MRRHMTRGVDVLAKALRSLWYRHLYLSWVRFGRSMTFAGPIRCPGVTGTMTVGDRVYLGADICLAVADGGHISVGDDCSINAGTILSSRSSLVIGAGTRIGDHCSIRDSEHRVATDALILTSGFDVRPISIGANVWVGRLVTIMPGVTIGDGAVIGAHSLVNSDIPSGSLAFGTPVRVQRRLA